MRRIQIRRSGVHGKGVFALQDIAEGETIIEYVGEVISWTEAQRRHPHDPKDPNHTFYFHIDEDHVIDALYGGNSSRWINHSCDANCEADEEDGRVFIKALRNIAAGRRAQLRLRPDHRRALHQEAQGRVPLLVRRHQMPRHPACAQAGNSGKDPVHWPLDEPIVAQAVSAWRWPGFTVEVLDLRSTPPTPS